MKKIGILAIQGDFQKHAAAVEASGGTALEIRDAKDVSSLCGLIIPGGESTVIGKLIERYGLAEPLRDFARSGRPVFGTCAGAILLAKEIEGSSQFRLGLMDMKVRRNAYGRQIESFETDLAFPEIGEIPVRGVFIRAPAILETGGESQVLASYNGLPVFVRQDNLFACTFHPELTGDLRIHKFFLSLAPDEGHESL